MMLSTSSGLRTYAELLPANTLAGKKAGYLGTLRTDLRLAGVDPFLDFGGADFIGAGVSAFFSAGVDLLFRERLLVVFLDEDALVALLLELLDAFFVAERRDRVDLVAGAFDGVFGVDDAARAR
jgi:hypothetical protein